MVLVRDRDDGGLEVVLGGNSEFEAVLGEGNKVGLEIKESGATIEEDVEG